MGCFPKKFRRLNIWRFFPTFFIDPSYILGVGKEWLTEGEDRGRKEELVQLGKLVCFLVIRGINAFGSHGTERYTCHPWGVKVVCI